MAPKSVDATIMVGQKPEVEVQQQSMEAVRGSGRRPCKPTHRSQSAQACLGVREFASDTPGSARAQISLDFSCHYNHAFTPDLVNHSVG